MYFTQGFYKYLLHTHREVPSESEIVSHQLMLRAGMIKKLASGIYSYLPFGLRSIRKLEGIVRQEMDRSGALELLMPCVQPAEIWHESGRWRVYGDELLRFTDRHHRDFCFGPTHEEVITDICRKEVRSYRDLPLNLYQIQTKFRDEVRPRFGLMRGREFIMKDAYSFDLDQKCAFESYERMKEVYQRIFERCSLEFRMVEALTGNIGGTRSHEFQVLADSGEDIILSCKRCPYAANIEKASIGSLKGIKAKEKVGSSPEEIHTPGLKSVEEVAAFLKVQEKNLIKTLVYQSPKGIVIALVRGDHEVNEHKLMQLAEVDEVQLATDAQIEELTGAPVGFSGPLGIQNFAQMIADQALLENTPYVVGANKKDYHYKGVVLDRDFSPHQSGVDLRKAQAGDLCPNCKEASSLEMSRGIEVGQIFYLGTKYSQALQAFYLDQEGKELVMEMGCYGIGIGRTIAAAIEQNHDESGIIFPMPLAPFQVCLIDLGRKGDETSQKAHQFHDDMEKAQVEVLYDDRDERAGVKFNDADLIGIPLQVVVGKKGIQEGVVEIKIRKTGEKKKVKFESLISELKGHISKELKHQ